LEWLAVNLHVKALPPTRWDSAIMWVDRLVGLLAIALGILSSALIVMAMMIGAITNHQPDPGFGQQRRTTETANTSATARRLSRDHVRIPHHSEFALPFRRQV
jgi:hypothetical protein